MERKTSAIWTTEKETLLDITKRNNTIAGILRELGYKVFTASSYKSIQSRLNKEGIDFSHIKLGLNTNKNRPQTHLALSKEEALEKWFVKADFKYSNHNHLRFIRKFQLLPNKCSECKNEGVWNGKKLVLQLDHINGCREDSRLENLRLLCPNCHSQSPTFAGKRNKKFPSNMR